jgi:HD-GYP domain-containing protein (c-di-GMP phosphodiesterase class II)/putative methionine-R-sulfoxide reductase with GAF domain
MPRRALDSLAILTAGILILISQVILLTPQALSILIRGAPFHFTLATGLVLFIAGLMSASTVVFERTEWKSTLAHILGALAIAGLSFLYATARLYLELPLLIALTVALLATAFLQKSVNPVWKDIPVIFSTLVNLTVGILILLSDHLPIRETYQTLSSWKILLGVVFLGSVIANVFAFLLPSGKWKPILSRMAALPWLAWFILHPSATPLANMIPAACFLVVILATDLIPWSRVKLPEDDILGHRLIVLSAGILSAFLVGFTFILNTTNESNPPGLLFNTISLNDEREIILVLCVGVEAILANALVSFAASIHELTAQKGMEVQPQEQDDKTGPQSKWGERISRLTRPFTSSQLDIQKQLELQTQQVTAVSKQLEKEKRKTAQLTLLSELSQQLEAQLDMPVAAQLAVNTLQKSLNCSFTALYLNDSERRELVALATAGTRASILPPGYRQAINVGVLGRAVRVRKTQVINDCRQDPDYIRMENENTISVVAIPLIDHGHMKGILKVSDERANAFASHDVQIAEAVAAELLRAWERSEYHQRLTELIQAGVSLTTQPDPQAAVQEVANIARQTLRARFAFVTLLDQEGNFTRSAHAGNAPRLLKSVGQNSGEEPLMQAALNATRPFRIRDLRKYKRASHIELDYAGLRSVIAIPIRMHRLSVGAMLAFGKQGEVFFTENDESLASLLSSQAAAAIESAWLSHELRSTLATTTQLYQLSFHVIQAEELTLAAKYIAEGAQKLCGASSAGIVLFATDRRVEAEVQLDANGLQVPANYPGELVQRAMETQQSIFMSAENDVSNVCFPLKTPKRTYGALWLAIPDSRGTRYATNLQTLANQAAVALERSILLVESREQATTIEDAYLELETTYDRTLAALMSALDARDRETEGHSIRVARVARRLGEKLQLPENQLKALERGSLLHDIGKIGISDTILHKPGPLDENEWKTMRLHPDIGARIVEDIPFLQDTLAVVRYHQERWDGSGYPIGLTGKNIPLLARIFSVVDAFDALTSNRPYRTQIDSEEAFEYLRENAGILFDPEIVAALTGLDARKLLESLESNE